jgi:hypothetical protein
VSWRIVPSDTAFEGLSQAEEEAVTLELFSWVDNGPPRGERREVFGVELFQDELPSGYEITYFVSDAEQHAAIVRVRKA